MLLKTCQFLSAGGSEIAGILHVSLKNMKYSTNPDKLPEKILTPGGEIKHIASSCMKLTTVNL